MEKNINNKENKKKLWIIGIGAIIILFIVGIILYNKVSEDNCTNVNGNTSSNNTITNNNSVLNTLQNFEEKEKKPIIYLYPEKTIEVCVKVKYPEKFTCTYPQYKNGWNVVANPDGTLIDTETGRELYALYWEGIYNEQNNFEEGFVIKGSETISFLEEKLEILGLSEKEAEEFIIYWLPELQKNEYNYIRFATIDEINRNMPLEFSVEPDTLIRVLMQYKALDGYTEVKEQKLEKMERKGFTVVEWGGMEI